MGFWNDDLAFPKVLPNGPFLFHRTGREAEWRHEGEQRYRADDDKAARLAEGCLGNQVHQQFGSEVLGFLHGCHDGFAMKRVIFRLLSVRPRRLVNGLTAKLGRIDAKAAGHPVNSIFLEIKGPCRQL